MKNLKNMFAWITLAVVLMVGTVGANAGIILTDAPQCTDDKGGIVQDILGIIIVNAPQVAGIIIVNSPCKNGIIIVN